MEVNDDIHGIIALPDYIAIIVKTPMFERLKSVKQLGFLSVTEPRAAITRYEHCIGTYWLASKMLDALYHNTGWLQSAREFEMYRKAVEIAALLHDIGHGPFSHHWESVAEEFHHESNAKPCVEAIFSYLEQIDYGCEVLKQLAALNSGGVEFIIALILGDKNLAQHELPKKYTFLFQIVNNKKCKIDVDKWDYMLRDCHYLKHLCDIDVDFDNLFLGARVSNDGTTIQYRYEEYHKIYEMFQIRWALHTHAYRLPKTLALEKLMTLIIKKGNYKIGSINLEDITGRDQNEFLQLFDANVLQIVGKDPNAVCFTSPDLLKRINQDEALNPNHFIKISDTLIGPGLEMPPDHSFDFYGDKKMRQPVTKMYSVTHNVYFFRLPYSFD